jgi:hypothetical protein
MGALRQSTEQVVLQLQQMLDTSIEDHAALYDLNSLAASLHERIDALDKLEREP